MVGIGTHGETPGGAVDSDRNVCRLSFMGSVALGAALLILASHDRVVGACTGRIVLPTGIGAARVAGGTSAHTGIEAQAISLVHAIVQLRAA